MTVTTRPTKTPSDMERQLTFDLGRRPALGREDFFVSPANAAAVTAIEDWTGWPQGKLVLVGPEGAGKTHLVAVWSALSGAAILHASALGQADLPGLAAGGAVAVRDADRVSDEAALFHLHNLLAEARGALLLSARTPPARWPLRLPDLASRMQAASVVTLGPPDDALLGAALLKGFADRQLAVQPSLLEYLIPRMDRSMAGAARLVAALDAAALEGKRPVNRTLAALVLARLDKDLADGA